LDSQGTVFQFIAKTKQFSVFQDPKLALQPTQPLIQWPFGPFANSKVVWA